MFTTYMAMINSKESERALIQRARPRSASSSKPTAFGLVLCLCLIGCGLYPQAAGDDVIRKEIASGAIAMVKHGRNVGLEAHPPRGEKGRVFLQRFLADETKWTAYKDRLSVFIPFGSLKPPVQREILLAVYPKDMIDEAGWHHTVIDERETLWSLCDWLTGHGNHYKQVMNDPANGITNTALGAGQVILVPHGLLAEHMRTPTQTRLAEIDFKQWGSNELEYGEDKKGAFAVYRLRKGEALYSAVVARFTDFRDNDDILEATNIIARRSNIRDVRDIDAGQRILIPATVLSDRYQPKGMDGRESFDASVREAARLRKTPARSRDLSDVVIILDAGHGGRDPGARYEAKGLYEDEINYDIVMRIKRLLEAETGARVYVTIRDRSSGSTPTDRRRFEADSDEELTTQPPYKNDGNSKVSANLRWMLVNSIYQKELDRGTDSRKILFTSIHTDALGNGTLRGAMIYVPSAALRRGEEVRRDAVYARYVEGRNFNRFSSSQSERLRDEAMSRNFAAIVMRELGRKRIKRHDQGDPIRSQIRRSRNVVFVPAVLRNTKVPTKILIETANLMNATDRKWLSDPWWRQQFARAYVDAVKVYFGASQKTLTAQARR